MSSDSGKDDALGDCDIHFLYKTMLNRDPKKRKVKPVERHLEELYNLVPDEDSSDDSDYKPLHKEEDDDDDIIDGSSDEDGSEEGSDSDDSDQDVKPTNKVPKTPEKKISLNNCKPSEVNTTVGYRSPYKAYIGSGILVCSVCLGDISRSDDEIVECDSCGVSVHEGCYGIVAEDNESVHSNTSSASTEPWFCDPCKANVTNPCCELCPNSGGIFKVTDVGRWVHMVCALYIPGVAFGDVTKLTGLTLFEMPYSRWGAKACNLCEDERLTRTGVCICCDAGMCKSYFHVTCAQREGLLSEAHSADEVDPFFAYCKMHADRATVKSKRRNWLTLQSKTKNAPTHSMLPQRTQQKLQKHRIKWKKSREDLEGKTWVPTQKIPRLLTTSPSAVKRLIRKAELLGMSPQTHIPVHEVIDVRRKWHVPPAFSLEYVSYYLDRNNRMNSMQKRSEELKQQNTQLNETQHSIRTVYDNTVHSLEKLKNQNAMLRNAAKHFWSILNDFSKNSIPLPKLLETPEPVKNEKSSTGNYHKKVAHKKSSNTSVINIVECGICKRTNDQHQMALCDSCLLHYHLYCLDPPLTRMPKKTRFGGWQCSDCTEMQDQDSNEEDASNQSIVDGAKRKLREHVKGPNKFEPDDQSMSGTSGIRRKRKDGKKKRRRRKKRKILVNNEDNEDSEKANENNLKPVRTPTVKKPINLEEKCSKCDQIANCKILVQCDECSNFYHFSCLDPPVKKSPKQRGYTWYCENCDNSDDDEDNDDDDDEDEDQDESEENDD